MSLVYIALVIGGILGGVLRYAISILIPTPNMFPLGILCINLCGSLVLGLFFGLAEIRPVKPWLHVGFGTGLIGSFTTFSTFCTGVDSLGAAHFWLSAIYILISIIGGPSLTFIGERSVSVFARRLVKVTEEFFA
ncbi:MAG: CrcB family protein [Alicyclobacillus sp.]|nr:CrcB family protein [Alicyclobacillus sp.]